MEYTKPIEKVLKNLTVLSDKASILDERRICELHELAAVAADYTVELFDGGLGFFDALAILSEEIVFDETEPHSGALIESIHWLTSAARDMSVLDRSVFCSMLVDRLRERECNIREADFLEGGYTDACFTYVKNRYADEAFDVFSQDFKSPTVKYCQSFKAGLDMLESGEADFCLLPLEERGARLPSIESLIYRKDFKIGSITPVFGYDGTADLKYALVRRGFSVPEVHSEDDRYMEIRIPKEPRDRMRELLSVSEYFGIDIYKINTVYIDTDEETEVQYSLIMKTEGRDFVTMLTYLTLFTDEYVPMGIYKNIE